MDKDFIWVLDVLESCKTKWQLEGAESLIALFHKKYGKEGERYSNHLIEALASKVTSIDKHKHDESKLSDIS